MEDPAVEAILMLRARRPRVLGAFLRPSIKEIVEFGLSRGYFIGSDD